MLEIRRHRNLALGLGLLAATAALGVSATIVAQEAAPPKVTVTLNVIQQPMKVMGVDYQAWTFGGYLPDLPPDRGTVPGPIIRITQGTELTIVLRNGHTETHSFHTHFQHYTMDSDGTSQTMPLPFTPHQNDNSCAVVHSSCDGFPLGMNPVGSYIPREDEDVARPGEAREYHFSAGEVGTFIYHCHVYPVDEHIEHGLFGVILVYPKGWTWEDRPSHFDFGNVDSMVTDASGNTWFEDVIVLSELDRTSVMSKAGVPTTGGAGKIHQTNFRSWNDPYYLGPVPDGTPMRIVVANLGTEVHSWHVHAHNFNVLDKFDPAKRVVYRSDTLLVEPGSSYETTLVARHPGFWFVHDHSNPNAYAGMIAWLRVEEPGV